MKERDECQEEEKKGALRGTGEKTPGQWNNSEEPCYRLRPIAMDL